MTVQQLWRAVSRRRRTSIAVAGLVGATVAVSLWGPWPDRSTASPAREPSGTSAPTSRPTATPAGPPAGTAAPSTPLGDEWAPVIDQEFTKPAALGQFARVYPGWADYDSYRDTAKKGVYDSHRVVSVADGILTEHLHTESGQPYVVSITPVPHVQTYGRYEIRFRADVIPGYKIAWLLWPADDRFGTGEVDFPEAALRPGDQVQGFAHQIDGNGFLNQWTVATGKSPQVWHTAVIEWRPQSLTFILDGVAWSTSDPRAVPTVPMYWSMQTETFGDPDPAAAGDIQIDYVKAWRYVPGRPAA